MAKRHWLDWILAPMYWLERARGWRRLALVGLYFVVFGVVGVLIAREAFLGRVPDTPEPFDPARWSHIKLADRDNAMVFYIQANRKLKQLTARGSDPPTPEDIRAVLDLWLQGGRCSDSLLVQPDDLRSVSHELILNDLWRLNALGLEEGRRLGEAGKLGDRWTYILAAIRAALHAGRHPGEESIRIWIVLLQQATLQATQWSNAPNQTPELLHRAIADLAAARSLQVSWTERVRDQYFRIRAAILDPMRTEALLSGLIDQQIWYNQLPGSQGFQKFFANEPKRSLRLLRFITAGLLAQEQRPRELHMARTSLMYPIYPVDALTPPVLARIKPEVLIALVESSCLRYQIRELGWDRAEFDRIAKLLDSLAVELARKTYRVDHNGQPAKTFKDLRDAGYLATNPVGVLDSDPLELMPQPTVPAAPLRSPASPSP